MTNITKVNFMTPAVAEDVAKRVLMMRDYWINRGWGWTLGAATYQDTPAAYPALANYTNRVLSEVFMGVYKSLAEYFKLELGMEVISLKGVALPGFHIFTEQSNGHHGHPHIDEPYKGIQWPAEVTDPFSFTLALALPRCGGGLGYWPAFTDEDIETFMGEDELPPATLLDYVVGTMYIHSGKTPHRIQNYGDMLPGEARITLQGHAVTMDGQLVIYF